VKIKKKLFSERFLYFKIILFLFSGRIIGLFRLSYLTPGLMAAGVTEVIVEKEQEQTKKEKVKKKDEKKEIEGKKR